MLNIKNKISDLGAGFAICLILGLLAQLLAGVMPTLGAALFAILLGILAGNTIFTGASLAKGRKFSESRLLEYSIVMTGLTMNMTDIAQVGIGGIVFILVQMTLTISVAYIIGRALKFGKKFTLLMCAGNAVCGSSAIATVSDVIKPDAKDKGISITTVNLTGTVLMVTLPLLTGVLYNHDTLLTSAMIGGTLQSIGQCIGSATFVNADVVALATIFKIIRIMFIVLVALAFANLNTEDEGSIFANKNSKSDKTDTKNDMKNHAKIKAKVPWYIIGFFICAIITSLSVLPNIFGEVAHAVSSQFEIIALAAIGMGVKFKDLLKEGPRALIFGGSVGLCQVLIATLLISVFF